MKYLFEEFSDIAPDEIAHGLPPMRDIQCCIDLILGSVLSNKATYQMNLKEHKELHRKVNKLMEKGLVRKNKSPFVVHALLVLKNDGLAYVC